MKSNPGPQSPEAIHLLDLDMPTEGISTGSGMLLFVTSIAGQLYLVISVYVARITLKEIIAHAEAP